MFLYKQLRKCLGHFSGWFSVLIFTRCYMYAWPYPHRPTPIPLQTTHLHRYPSASSRNKLQHPTTLQTRDPTQYPPRANVHTDILNRIPLKQVSAPIQTQYPHQNPSNFIIHTKSFLKPACMKVPGQTYYIQINILLDGISTPRQYPNRTRSGYQITRRWRDSYL